MKRLKFLSVGALILGSALFTSCKKEGCTDPDSKNYSVEADKDDGSCRYEGNVVFWYNQATANELIDDDAFSLTYYVDGKAVGSSATSVFWSSRPNCGQNSSITVTKDLGSLKSKSYQYRVVDQTGFEYWSGSVNFIANKCEANELIW